MPNFVSEVSLSSWEVLENPILSFSFSCEFKKILIKLLIDGYYNYY